ncbi:ABC transporter ATP-binding protein [Paenibacillus tepidiphilus]|uniref:ABC transporter ATP-binding protein n=1 Tax=Paenibacillus tepidiphilus TaxID=2608683 RepID=UPI001238FA8B|nr:ABC transporter ATP-binding protein [Paenibacillus tepidiphilus]
MEQVIEVSNVSKSFRDKQALRSISFGVPKGSVTAILGPNGAGKTTLLSILLGLQEPSAGTAKVFGLPPQHQAVRARTGAMLQEVSVLDRLKAGEIIELVRGYYPHPVDTALLLEASGLAPGDLRRYAEKLSGGQKRSLGFALALAGNPDLLFFDEPTVGLDTVARRRFWERVRFLAGQGKTVLFTTHYLQEAEDYADRILLFSGGMLAADGSPAEIKSRIAKRSLSFRPAGDPRLLREQLLQLPAIQGVEEHEGRLVVRAENADEALRLIFAGGLGVRDILVEQGSLEEAFEQLTLNPGEGVRS